MSKIGQLYAREILDSRGNPTLEVDCTTESGAFGRAQVPSGASTGDDEAWELRDNDKKRYLGKGVRRAIRNVNEVIQPALLGVDVTEQALLDHIMIDLDGTELKKKLGANAILGVSWACCRAAGDHLGLAMYRYLGGVAARVLPVPLMNVINGGAHAPNHLDIQEYMLVPAGAPDYPEALRYATEVFHHLKKLLAERDLIATVGDEGGFAPNLTNNEEPIQLILRAIEKAGYQPGEDIFLALDCAASNFYRRGRYQLKLEHRMLTTEELVELYFGWVKRYPIISIEDGLAEDDWRGWQVLTRRLGDEIQIVGDDIFVTNAARLRKGIEYSIANACIIKPNQVGTITETLDTIRLAQRYGYRIVVSHRSGETEYPMIADLAVATNAGQIKAGAPCRSERTAKYNALLRIGEEIEGVFPGLDVFHR